MTQTVPPLTLRAYQCASSGCGAVFQAVPTATVRCTKCGSPNIKRMRLATSASPTPTVTAPTVKAPAVKAPAVKAPAVKAPPVVATPTIPAPPKGAPPLMKSSPAPSGPVKSLAQQLQESKVGVLNPATGARTIDRNALDHNAYDRAWDLAGATLPAKADAPTSQAEVQALIRHVANNVKAKSVPQVTISFLMRVPFLGPDRKEWTLAQRVTLDLSLPLREMARGLCRPLEHGNANTAFGNHERILPEYVEGERITYREFGWRYPVPATATGTTRNGRTTLKILGADEGTQAFLATRVAQDGYSVDAGLRLVISDWGYLFLTTDHYRSFRMYDPVREMWRAYSATKNADASWYQRGEPEAAAKIPVSAPRFW